jgi:hypothetical protein
MLTQLMKRIAAFVLLALVQTANAQETAANNYYPKEGYVPDAETAIRIAVAVWEPIYGKEIILTEKPYKACAKGGIWIITGSLPVGSMVGVALAEISKKDGQVLRVSHGK